jgi:hypothetical protein
MLIAAAVIGAALTSACGSMSPQTGVSAFEVDRDQMAVVEAAARQAGTRVHWVNPPLKPRQ